MMLNDCLYLVIKIKYLMITMNYTTKFIIVLRKRMCFLFEIIKDIFPSSFDQSKFHFVLLKRHITLFFLIPFPISLVINFLPSIVLCRLLDYYVCVCVRKWKEIPNTKFCCLTISHFQAATRQLSNYCRKLKVSPTRHIHYILRSPEFTARYF